MLGQAGGQHVRDHAGHVGGPEHVIETLKALAQEIGVDVVEEVIHILHRQFEVLESQRVGQPRGLVEFRAIDNALRDEAAARRQAAHGTAAYRIIVCEVMPAF